MPPPNYGIAMPPPHYGRPTASSAGGGGGGGGGVTAGAAAAPAPRRDSTREPVGMDMAASLQPSAVQQWMNNLAAHENALLAQRVAAAEAKAAAAELLKDQVVEAEARAAAAEAWAAAVAEERETEKGAEGDAAEGAAPSWLARLAGGEVDSLGEVEVVSAVSEAAMTARAPAESLDDVAAKQRWLKSLDVPMWGRAAVALSEAASDAAGMAALSAQCDSGDDVSCRILSEQDEDSQAGVVAARLPRDRREIAAGSPRDRRETAGRSPREREIAERSPRDRRETARIAGRSPRERWRRDGRDAPSRVLSEQEEDS